MGHRLQAAWVALFLASVAWGGARAEDKSCLGGFRFKPTPYLRRLRHVCVPGRMGPPRVNGAPEAKEWAGAARLSTWFVLGKPVDKAGAPGEVWLAYDRAGLYLAGVFRDASQPRGKAGAAPVSGLTVTLLPAGGARYEFGFAPDGGLAARRDDDPTWRARLRHRARRLKDGWRLEATLPWAILGMRTPKPLEAMEASFALDARTGDRVRRLSVFPSPGFGVLVFGKEAAYVKALRRLLGSARFGVRLYMSRHDYDGNDAVASCRAVLTSTLPARPLLAKSSLRLAVDAGDRATQTTTLKSLASNTLDFTLDLRRLKRGEHRLRVQVVGPKGAVRGATERSFRILPKAVPPTLKRSVRIRLWRFPETLDWPAEVGVAIPKGELWGDGVRLLGPDGRPIPAEARAVARWGPKGSTQWLRVAFVAPAGAKELRMEYGARVRPTGPKRPLKVSETPDEIAVDTGAVRFAVRKRGFRLFERVEVGALRRALPLSGQDLAVEDERGESYLSSLDTASRVAIEEKGALQTTIRAEGWHVSRSGGRCGRYVVRLTAWAGSPVVRLNHTFVVTADSARVRYRDLAIRPGWIGQRVLFGAAGDKAVTVGPNTAAYFLQWSGNAYSLVAGGKPQSGEGAGGWVDVSAKSGGVTTAIRDFARNFPKEFEWRDGRTLVVHLWPRHGRELAEAGPPTGVGLRWLHTGRVLDFSVPKSWRKALGPEAYASASSAQAMGLAKTHEIRFFFHPREEPTERIQRFGRAMRRGAAAGMEAEGLARSGVLGPAEVLPPGESPRWRFVAGPLDCLLRRREALGAGGMFDFGDTHHRFHPAESRYDLQRNWCGFARPGPMWGWAAHALTGSEAYREFAADGSRHALDLDMCHYVSPDHARLHGAGPAGKTVGGVCEPNGVVHWQGGARADASGGVDFALLDFYATGRRRARDCADELGRALLRRKGRDGDASVALGGLYHATWDNDYLQAVEDALRPWLRAEGGEAAFPADAMARYVWWTGRPEAKKALVRWATGFLARRPPLEDLDRLPCAALAHAFLQTKDSRFLALAMGYQRLLALSVYDAGGPLERGDFTAPERPGLVGAAVAQAPALLFALQRAEGPIEPAEPRFRLRPWRGERVVRVRGREVRAPHYELAASLRAGKGKPVLLHLDLRHEGNVTVRLTPAAGGRPVFSKKLYARRRADGRRSLTVPVSSRGRGREFHLTFASDAPFSLTAPVEVSGVAGLVWRAPAKGHWILSPGGRAFFRAPAGKAGLRALGGAGLHAMSVHVAGGAGRTLCWSGQGEREVRLNGGGQATGALWVARAGMGDPLRLSAPEVGLRVATAPERHFDAEAAR